MPAPKEFKSRSEKPSERFSKMGDGGGRYSSLLPRWPRVRADHSLPRRPGAILESAWHVRAPKRGFVNQATALARPGRLPLVSGPEGDPRPAVSRCPPPPPPTAVSLFSDVTLRPRPSPPTLPPSFPPSPLPTSSSWRPIPCSLQSPGRARLPPRPGRGCAPLCSPQLAFVIPAPFLASPPTPRRAAKRGARSRRHTWNPKRAPGRSLPRSCGEEG